MYFRILKKDLKRKKTTNIILLIFIILAATFIASSANNMTSVMKALDSWFEKAEVPDYWFATIHSEELERYEEFAEENNYHYNVTELVQISQKDVEIDREEFDYSNTLSLSVIGNATKVFDSNDEELTEVKEGEIYVTSGIFHSDKNNLKIGNKIKICANGKEKTFTLKGYVKDVMFGSSMIGMTRFLISQDDLEYFVSEHRESLIYSVNTYTDDEEYKNKFAALDLFTVFNVDRAGIKKMYIMDMLIAAVLLIVSVCLILISMVILRFTINFTMSEEFREIGVMKAIGITNRKIRGLYLVKYLAISTFGSVIGFICSIPFGTMMMQKVSQNIVMSNDNRIILNAVCAVATAALVVLFCYFCTRKIRKFRPIDAIRNGENGERYQRKGVLSLSRGKIAVIPFLALNDILSGLKQFITMIIIFILGLLLIIIPVNTINTLQSDNLLNWFNMAECDHVIAGETLLQSDMDWKKILEEKLQGIETVFDENDIDAEVFQEVMFRMGISHNGKRMQSMAFQGIGEINAGRYAYIKGTAPQNSREVAITGMVAERIGAEIGDDVEIRTGETTKKYTVCAIYQSMNNFGEGIRFSEEETLDYKYVAGCCGIQVKYKDNPDESELTRRKELLRHKIAGNGEVYSAGEYANYMIGDVAGQLGGIKQLILVVVVCINTLVTVLMVRSFIIKEKGEIAMLKAIGFKNGSLILWQTLRIGIVLFISIVIAPVLSMPLSQLTIGPVFQMMGAQSIEFVIKPIDIYVVYPVSVFCVTAISALIASLRIRKISPSETSGTE